MLIDANVFKGYFQMQMGKGHSLSGCPHTLFQSVTPTTPVYHDSAGIIEHEWSRVVDRDWFEAWLASSLVSGIVQYQNPGYDQAIENKLHGLGFPNGRDIVYVRVGLTVAAIQNQCCIFTEDMDFYDPTLKGGAAKKRLKVIRASSGPVPKLLAKRGINVRCVP